MHYVINPGVQVQVYGLTVYTRVTSATPATTP